MTDPSELVNGHMASRVCTTAVRLGVLETLRDGPRGLDELATATDCPAGTLRRLLRALRALDVLDQPAGDRFALTERGRGLLVGHGDPWAPGFARFFGHPEHWRAWAELPAAVQQGGSGFEHSTGETFFGFMDHDPGLAADFHRAMAAGTERELPRIVAGYDFDRYAHLVDVGGGDGTLLAAILARHPHPRGTVVDGPAALAGAPDVLAAHGVGDRVSLAEGDFFGALPAGGDGYLLKNILHDWSDEESATILRRCRDALGADGRVLVLTGVVPAWDENDDPAARAESAAMDMEMLVMTSGRERTLEEYDELFAAAGLRRGEVVRLPGLTNFHVIEAVPAA